MRSMAEFFEPAWYLARNPDIAASGLDPLLHYIRHGAEEKRDPNSLFDSTWYADHYPDVAASGLHPLLHYLRSGAAELRNPHPRFDAMWYVSQYPEAADNVLLYHLQLGRARGNLTEKPLHIKDYLPSERPAPRPPYRVFADIVIPVYRGLAETQRCLESVLADTDRPMGRIIVVDDHSPEPALSAWLQTLAADGRIHLFRNERNLGFVASVNRGMAEAGDHDVALLNSDTEVPNGWLTRLMAQAHAHPRIASVSPLSNNATICSWPDNAGGPIPFGGTVASVDAVCRAVNAGRWVDVPTTVGFAMYIRRDALADIGDFDAERFTLGYGEENDFCLRASARGWIHRLACDTFVYHQGSVSFGDRMKKLTARATELILERFPDYHRRIAQHVTVGAADPFRFAIAAALFRACGLPVILMVSHSMGGGIRRHIDMLVDRTKDKVRVLLLEATDRGATLSVPALPNHPVLQVPADRTDDLILLLRSMNVSRLHIHHLLGMALDMRRVIRRLGVPFDVTVHDYHAICPQINFLPWRHSLYCGEPDVGACNDCIAHRSSHGAREILSWRAEHAWPFHEADRVLCPSQDVVVRLRRYGLADRAVLAPHEQVAAAPWMVQPASPGTGRLRIAVIGTLVDHKGARTVAAVAEAADPKTTEIHLIGDTDGPFPAAALKRMKVTGRYQEADLPDLIKAVAPHVVWFPMAWPETYSYTLSAAIDAGVAIAAPRIGAFTERLEGRPLTWMAEVATAPRAWIDLFETIRSTLRNGAIASASVRPARADFYAADYLRGPDAAGTQPRGKRPAARPAAPSAPRVVPRVVIVPERFASGYPTPAAYLRLLQPLLHPSITADATVRVTDAAGALEADADVIITQRLAVGDLETVASLAAHAGHTGAALVFDLDEDLLDIPATHPEAARLRQHARVVRRMLDVADRVWLGNQGLAERLASVRSDAIVLETRLDQRIWTPPPAACPAPEEPVRILCMGARTRGADIAMLQPALLRLKAEYGDRVVIDILGMTSQSDLPAEMNRIGPSVHASQSYPGFVNWLTGTRPCWHIGLAPNVDPASSSAPFSGGSSVNPAPDFIGRDQGTLDYAAMGLIILASDTAACLGAAGGLGANNDPGADGTTGGAMGGATGGGAGSGNGYSGGIHLMPSDPDAWYAALDWLMRNRDLRQRLLGQSRAAFVAHGTLEAQAGLRRDAWTRVRRARPTETAA